MNIKVSIVVPIYNAEKWIGKSIGDLCAQTYSNIEIICVDDGSKDKSIDILKELQNTDERIIVIHQDNQGAGAARNSGMKVSQGDYIIFLDADDRFEPDLIEVMLREAIANVLDIVICDAVCFDNATGIELPSEWIVKKNMLPDKAVFTYRDMPDNIYLFSHNVAWNKLYRKDFLLQENLVFQNSKHTNDTYFTCLSLVCAKSIKFINKKLVHYRQHSKDSLTSTGVRTAYPLCIGDVLAKIQKELIDRKIYSCVWKSFANLSIKQLLFNLNCMDKSTYHILYKKIRDEWIDKFDITRLEEKDVLSRSFYEKIQQIRSMSYEEVVINRLSDLEERLHKKEELLKFYERFIFCEIENGGIKEFLRRQGLEKFIMYGYGTIGKMLVAKLCNASMISAIIDKKYAEMLVEGIPIFEKDKIAKMDLPILVTPFYSGQEIKDELLDYGITEKKIVLLKDII